MMSSRVWGGGLLSGGQSNQETALAAVLLFNQSEYFSQLGALCALHCK